MTRAEEHLVLSFSAPKNWAKDVAGKLALVLDAPGDRVVTRTAPDGKDWNLRVVVAAEAPPLILVTAVRPEVAAAERELLDRPEAGEQQDTNTTVTELLQFAKCPREYFLGKYVGFEGRTRRLVEADAELSAAEFGTQVHTLLSGAVSVDADPEALRLAESFRQSPLGRRVARASRVEREFDFLMAVEGLVIRGQVDLWFLENGELTIVDYKTDAVTAAQARHRAQDYALQLRLYGMAVERFAGRPVDRAWLHFLRPNVPVEVDLSPSLLESPEQIVREFQEAQSKMEFPLIEGERCLRCPFYKDLCPAGMKKAIGPPQNPDRSR